MGQQSKVTQKMQCVLGMLVACDKAFGPADRVKSDLLEFVSAGQSPAGPLLDYV